jgi:hypothetical protein
MAHESKNRKKSADLAVITQSYEAHFFHKVALNSLTEQFPDRQFYVVQDSIGVPEDISSESKTILNKALFNHLGIPNELELIRFSM